MNHLTDEKIQRVETHKTLRKFFGRIVLRYTNMLELRKTIWMAGDPYLGMSIKSSDKSQYPYSIGIIKEPCNMHLSYVAACQELGVAFKLIDIYGPDWLDIIENADCDAFLIRPSGLTSVWKGMYDEKVRVMVMELGLTVFPSCESLWLYESKRRMHYWLKAHRIPHPQTWVFYDQEEALRFVNNVKLPIVYKSDFGAGASGVKIFRCRSKLKRHIKKCFKKGYRTYTRCISDKEWGSIFLQEYLANIEEWRIIRLGDSYFGYEKIQQGDYHSGSHAWRYGRPSDAMLNLARDITLLGNFTSMAVDMFKTTSGQLIVNELQALFGVDDPSEPQCVINGKAGRMIWDKTMRRWNFQEGDFCKNSCCNLRIKELIKELNSKNVKGISGLVI